MKKKKLEELIGNELILQKLTLCVAESCTGGLMSYRLTKMPGSSAYLDRGFIVYSDHAKHEILGVCKETILSHGAVSQECVLEMAIGAKKRSNTDLSLAISGIAGPEGGSPKKPVGTIWFGLASQKKIITEHYYFYGNRATITIKATDQALAILYYYLKGYSSL